MTHLPINARIIKLNLYSSLAQSVEHAAVNRRVVGSSPTGGATKGTYVCLNDKFKFFFIFGQNLAKNYDFGSFFMQKTGNFAILRCKIS